MASATTQRSQTSQEIFDAIEQLETDEADQLSLRLLQLRAQRKAPHLSEREAELLKEIYREKSSGFQLRFDELNSKRRSYAITENEHSELLELNDESEAFTLNRVQALAELAQLRRLTLPALMEQLGLKAPPVV